MPALPWCAGPAASPWRALWLLTWRCPGDATEPEIRSVPRAREGAAREQIGRLRALVEQIREHLRDLADEALGLVRSELRVGGDRGNIELPFAHAFFPVFRHQALVDREAVELRAAIENRFDARAERCFQVLAFRFAH